MNDLENTKEIKERIFELLKRRGPLCQSQLSAHLLVGPKKVDAALLELEKQGIVEHRTEHSEALRRVENPWGLATPRIFGRRKIG